MNIFKDFKNTFIKTQIPKKGKITHLRTTALLTRPTLQYVLHVVQRGLQKKEHLKKYGGRKANRQKYRIAEYKIGQTCQKLWDVCQENDTRDIKMETKYVKM